MKAKMNDRARFLTAALLFVFAPVSACAVDFDGYIFDDEKLAEEEGGECIKFCDDQEEICGFDQEFRYASKDDCLMLCSGYFENELSCRIEHLEFAIDGPVTHCPHTIEDGGNTCPDAHPRSCGRFCLRASAACPFDEGEDGVYPSGSACEDACATFSESGLECRFIELSKSEEDASECENLLPGSEACAKADN